MKKLIKIGSILLLCTLSLNLSAQEKKDKIISYSISWTPEYWGPNDGKFRFDAMLPINFESLVHFKPFRSLSCASGLGYKRDINKGLSWPELSIIDTDKSYTWIINKFRVPVQVYYHFSKGMTRFDPYLKTEFINEFNFSNMTYYENDIVSSKQSYSYYDSYLGVGFGNIFRADKSIGIIVEGSLNTVLDKDVLFDMYILKIKLGVLIK